MSTGIFNNPNVWRLSKKVRFVLVRVDEFTTVLILNRMVLWRKLCFVSVVYSDDKNRN